MEVYNDIFPIPNQRNRKVPSTYRRSKRSILPLMQVLDALLGFEGQVPKGPESKFQNQSITCKEKNNAAKPVNWQFTTKDARTKLKTLYPKL